ncbi:MAG: AraC family transcriptional regulator [Bacteroidetes bacterium]|nr:AraC family transcriptional regulator [Bacteroidota bacterium]MDA1120898.1 AraC family transcriptional regulator [Bacteroidota bacterium]
MQPILLKHVTPTEGSFKVWKNADPYHHNSWHYQSEYEITLIEKGRGTRFVGDHIEQYNDMDLIFLGPNLPHEWRSDLITDTETDKISSSLAIHFNRDFLGSPFYALAESEELNLLFERAKFGIKIKDINTINKVRYLIYKLMEKRNFNRLVIFFNLLNELVKCRDYELLCSEGYASSSFNREFEKINLVNEYVIKNFKNNISLEDIANTIHMTPASFCRYFKRCTYKTFVQYLNEIRVGYAKKLLVEDMLSISQVAFECGFNNLSNFNKHFRRTTEMTPKEYKNKVISKSKIV